MTAMIETIELNGRTYTVRIEPDYDAGYPWDNSDGHGPVIRAYERHGEATGHKKPGWRPLNSPDRNEYQYYYDWQAASKLARRDGWNAEPYDAPNRIQRAVQADFDYLRRFLAGHWEYIGVIVESEDGEIEELWGIESDSDYPDQVAQELAEQLDERIERDEQRRAFPVSVMGV